MPIAHNIPVRIISLSDNKYDIAKAKVAQTGSRNIQRWNAVRGKDLFDNQAGLLPNYRKILREKYPQVYLPKDVSLLSIHADKCLRSGEKGTVYDVHNEGAIGCYLSHISLWQYMVEKNIPAMIIYEDDVDFVDDKTFCAKLDNVLMNYPKDFDALNFNIVSIPYPFVDYAKLEPTELDNIVNVKSIVWRMQGYLLTLEGAKKLLKDVFPIVYSIDSYMSAVTMQPEFNMTLLAAKEPWLNHPLVVINSSIGYSYVQCLTDAVFLIPQIVIVLILATFLVLLVALVVYGAYVIVRQIFNRNKLDSTEKKL